jgi:hypothetical protein
MALATKHLYVNTVRAAFVVASEPDDADRKLLLPIKFNLGQRPTGLAYHIRPLDTWEQAGILDNYCKHLDERDQVRLARQLCRVEWDGRVSVTADEIMADWGTDKGPGKIDQAAEWLEELFKDGYARLHDDVIAAGAQAGLSKDNLFRARRDMLSHKIKASNKGNFGGVWRWGPGDPSTWIMAPGGGTASENAENADNGQNIEEKPDLAPIVSNVSIVGSQASGAL